MPISGNSLSSREECACARPFDATQWRHQLLACPVNSCSAICLALGSGGRFGTLGTIASSPSASSRIGSCAPAPPGTSGSGAPPPPGSSGSGFSGLTGSDLAGNPPRDDCLSLRTVASHQSCFLSVSCRCCTRFSLVSNCAIYDYATWNLSFTSHFSSFEFWTFYLDHSELGIMFSGIPTITKDASIAVCQLCQLVSARVLG